MQAIAENAERCAADAEFAAAQEDLERRIAGDVLARTYEAESRRQADRQARKKKPSEDAEGDWEYRA